LYAWILFGGTEVKILNWIKQCNLLIFATFMLNLLWVLDNTLVLKKVVGHYYFCL